MNQHVQQRIEAQKAILDAAYCGGSTLSTSSRGSERENFVEKFLKDVLPPIYRFGSGDATDQNGHRSGQFDIVVEYPFAPSLPMGTSTRLVKAKVVDYEHLRLTYFNQLKGR